MPDLYIITGSNGAGKSTLGPEYLPEVIKAKYKVFDVDLLYSTKLSELFPKIIPSAKYARKAAIDFVVELFEAQTFTALATSDNYVYEGHFINDETWETPRKFKSNGYRIHLLFLGLETPELSQFRVTERVTNGGHYVDTQTLNANFYGNLEKLNQHFELIDELTVVDTSDINHTILFKLSDGTFEYIIDEQFLLTWCTTYLSDILKLK